MRRSSLRGFAIAALLCGGVTGAPIHLHAQQIDFSQIDKFESLGTGTLEVGSPPKTIVDDAEPHTIFLTIYEADAGTKVYWKTIDGGAAKTTDIPGRAVQAFQTAGSFRLEASGEPGREVKYGYVLLKLKK
ncbi:MAG TPA: hypothetical protein VH206_16885 [Xanthobacteraceae bacterium]|nr:hypothetical protein [Xanthobacteraceae bacterium]